MANAGPKSGPKFDVDVQLSGNDGNAYSVLAAVASGIMKAGGTKEDTDAYFGEATSGDYDHLLQVSMEWVNVE